MRAMKLIVAGLVGLAGMTVAGAPAEAKGTPDPDAVRTVTKPLRVEKKMKATPIPEGTSYYCAVGAFVSFNDVAGFKPDVVAYDYFGDASTPIGPAPYDDKAAINGLAFPPVGGKHQKQIGDFTYGQGGYATPEEAAADCEALRQRVDDFFGPSATVSYVHTAKCKNAIKRLIAAKAKVKQAQRKLDKATTKREKAAARRALNEAKARQKKATQGYRAACT